MEKALALLDAITKPWRSVLGLAALVGIWDYQVSLPLHPALKRVFAAAGYIHVLRLFAQRRLKSALAVAAWTIRFPWISGGDRLNLASHLARAAILGGTRGLGLSLPPFVPQGDFLRTVRKNGPWRRHLSERHFMGKYGSVLGFWRPLSNTDYSLARLVVWVSRPDDVEAVLGDRTTFPSRGHTGFSELTKEGLLGLPTGPQWQKHRRVISKFLSEAYLQRASSGALKEEVEVLLGKWDKAAAEGSAVNCHYDLSVLTLDMIMRVGMGTSDSAQLLSEEENERFHMLDFMLREIVLRTALPFHRYVPSWLPFLGAQQKKVQAIQLHGQEIAEELKAKVRAQIESAGEEGTSPDTMLSALVSSHELSESEISDELQTIRGAGHETTSNTLCWTLLMLARHPAVLRKLRAEVDALVAGDVPTFGEVKQLDYAANVVYETLRLYPTVPTFPRLSAKPAKVGGYDIPAGTLVFVAQGTMGRSEEIWGPDAEEFRPERFGPTPPDLLPSRPVGVPGEGGPAYGFTPFGAGARTCVGQRLAMMEAVQILGALVKRFDFRLVDPSAPVQEFADITLGPKAGLPFYVERRNREQDAA